MDFIPVHRPVEIKISQHFPITKRVAYSGVSYGTMADTAPRSGEFAYLPALTARKARRSSHAGSRDPACKAALTEGRAGYSAS